MVRFVVRWSATAHPTVNPPPHPNSPYLSRIVQVRCLLKKLQLDCKTHFQDNLRSSGQASCNTTLLLATFASHQTVTVTLLAVGMDSQNTVHSCVMAGGKCLPDLIQGIPTHLEMLKPLFIIPYLHNKLCPPILTLWVDPPAPGVNNTAQYCVSTELLLVL